MPTAGTAGQKFAAKRHRPADAPLGRFGAYPDKLARLGHRTVRLDGRRPFAESGRRTCGPAFGKRRGRPVRTCPDPSAWASQSSHPSPVLSVVWRFRTIGDTTDSAYELLLILCGCFRREEAGGCKHSPASFGSGRQQGTGNRQRRTANGEKQRRASRKGAKPQRRQQRQVGKQQRKTANGNGHGEILRPRRRGLRMTALPRHAAAYARPGKACPERSGTGRPWHVGDEAPGVHSAGRCSLRTARARSM